MIPETDKSSGGEKCLSGLVVRHVYADPQCWFSRGPADILFGEEDSILTVQITLSISLSELPSYCCYKL